MATEAGHPASVHNALHKIIPLHPVLMRGAVGKVREAGLAQRVLFQLPKILQAQTHMIADRPVVIFAFDGTHRRAPLRMALNARIAGLHIIHSRWTENVGASWL